MLDEVIAEAIRIEYEEETGKLFIVFEVKGEKNRRDIKANWVDNIEYRLVGKSLVLNEHK